MVGVVTSNNAWTADVGTGRLSTTGYAILNGVAVQVTWFCAVLGGAAGQWWPGVLTAGITVLGHFFIPREGQRTSFREYGSEALRLGVAGGLGALIDTALVQLGFLNIIGGLGGPSTATSLWMIALWISFATSLTAGFAFLRRQRWWMVALLGGVAGAVSYAGGAKLGALTFPSGIWLAVAAVGIAWAIALPLMVAMTRERSGHD